ncbi:hypothetical protein SODALDRAFT_310283 [Sodiomyces alkalinus F11]|uniref:DUF1308 domain-containing protein n=1 Tax=Sodiomyces alkalinus (strain CBS 110278 / VKM F-3762 / F11) TaxID=1314773 RepID=A0A3N2PXH0_SODAK|nr:hypothetical protein SODALDRAFT_310283 [Sodiomyces alkalinus F11]ROT39045.1 hypothetical protein SODALDRAFT_310283 [Sodiomyces alkalinus F11]
MATDTKSVQTGEAAAAQAQSQSQSQSRSQASEDLAALSQHCLDMMTNITTLLDELQLLKAALDQQPAIGSKALPWNQAVPGLGAFERLVQSEKRNVEGMLGICDSARSLPDDPRDAAHPDDPDVELEAANKMLRHKLDACNYKFHQIVWDTAKKCHRLAGLRREMPRSTSNRKRDTVVVDVVGSGGGEWVKIITTTERRLFYEMTDAGWEWDEVEVENDGDGDGDDQASPLPLPDEGGENDIEILRITRQLVTAASLAYHEYRHPTVRVLLSRIAQGRNAHVDRLLNHVRTLGGSSVHLVVETTNSDSHAGGLLNRPVPPIDEATANLAHREPFGDFTGTLNVDCSVFMALASDFSHMEIHPGSPLLRNHQHRIDAEDEVSNGPRLLTTLYPAITGRDLVCTQDAADTFLKIVYDIGTDSEQARTRVLFGSPADDDDDDDDDAGADNDERRDADRRRRRDELAALSKYPVPEDLRLPIRTVGTITWQEAQRLVGKGELPEVALAVGRKGSGLNAMNVSSFLYGWKSRLTTITSNWEAAKRLRMLIETSEPPEDRSRFGPGPQIWRIPFARKLLARPREAGAERAPIKTRKERKVEQATSLERYTKTE